MAYQTLDPLILYILLYIIGLSSSEDVVLEVQRSILKEGFHREIRTSVGIQPNDFVIAGERPCSLLLIETLPAGLYVDTFQLDSLAAFGGSQVLADRYVDIEAPAYLSKEHELYVYAAVPRNNHPSSGPVTVTISLPVHVRYHRPSPDSKMTHLSVTIHHPRILLNCSRTYSRTAKAPCDKHNISFCSWSEVIYKSNAYFVEFQVPVGHEQDVRVTLFGTLIVTVMGCTFLLYILAFYDQWKVRIKTT